MQALLNGLFWLLVGAAALYGIATMEGQPRYVSAAMLAMLMILGVVMFPGVLTGTDVAAFLGGAAFGYLTGSRARGRPKEKDKRRK
jgi:uncharacterized membrane protein